MVDNLGNANRRSNKIEIGGGFSLALIRRCNSNNFSRFHAFINHCTPFRSIYFKEKVAPLTVPLKQLASGFETYGILGMMKQNKEEFKSIFVKMTCLLGVFKHFTI